MATDINELLVEQVEQIKRLYSNYKKTASSRYTVGYLETRKETLEEYWNTFKTDYKDEIKLKDISKEDKKHLKSLFERTEDLYLEFKTNIKEQLETKNAIPQCTHENPSNAASIKLPPINLPFFGGNYQEWTHFKDLFLSLIDKEPNLSDIQKHHYLRCNLKGEAAQLLRYLDVTAANYKKAWDTLVNRYDNKRIIVSTILNRLLNQKRIPSECSKSMKEILDTTNECLNSLTNLGIDTSSWDPLIVHITMQKFDIETHKAWEQSLGSSTDLPTYASLASFIEGRFRAVEMIQATQKKDRKESTPAVAIRSKNVKSFATQDVNTECTYCKGNHYICHCTEFSQLDVEQRKEFVKGNGLCFNCLVKGHSIKYCRQKTSCRTCFRKHHTLLHYSDNRNVKDEEAGINDDTENAQVTSMKVCLKANQVILATATIAVKTKYGDFVKLRALVDQGSQGTFIAESAVQRIGLKGFRYTANISGISNHQMKSRHMVSLNIHSPFNYEHILNINAHILPKLTPLLPTKEFSIESWPSLSQLKLSDPNLQKPGPIDVLLGADVYATILLEGLHKCESLIAQNSKLGWLVSGCTTSQTYPPTPTIMVSTNLMEMDKLIRKFWETEEYTEQEKPITLLDQQCEEYYKTTHTRTKEGRYVVRLPFKEGFEYNLGNSRNLAQNRLLQMEKRFLRNPEFQKQYTSFMDQYQNLGHMEDVEATEKPNHKVYYLPHNAVIRESSLTTKLRVVFDGAAKPDDGSSLNDELLVGPPLQQDLRDLIIRWRTHKICLLGDIKQMYRQILVCKQDADYQRILWRSSPQENIKEKRLLTVTYGTSCAPFLAIRTLKQLISDEKLLFPHLYDIVNKDFYMDDLLTGAHDEERAIELQKDITKLMLKGQFELHKWASNSSVVLQQISSQDKVTSESIDIKLSSTIKTLGIRWNSCRDVFELKLDISEPNVPFTKTTVLSDIARAFDSLGFLGPIIITAKIFLQKLWLCGVNWTDELPTELNQEWSKYREQLLNLDTIYVNRWFHTDKVTQKLEIHGFSDASTLAYAAVVYLRVIKPNKTHVSLIIAKTKVAPVKQVSLPRLELNAAVLLAKLLHKVKNNLNISDESVFAWTDSMIVLAWLRKHPNSWKTYVANRTTEILNIVDFSKWNHVKSGDNPADCASRGIEPSLLASFDLWWYGPRFLQESGNVNYLSIGNDLPDTSLECKTKSYNLKCTFASLISSYMEENLAYLNKFSNLRKLIRVTGYVLRFINNCRFKIKPWNITEYPSYLTVNEIRESFRVCIRFSQQIYFSEELESLNTNKKINKISSLKSLSPYLDKYRILRASGRLKFANISFDAKHPVLLSSKCNLALLIVKDAHIHALHGGPQLTLNVIRHKYWIIGAKNLVRKVIHKCITCYKHSATTLEQLMGQLPTNRVNPSRPFSNSGMDYAGPVTLKLYPGRCKRTTKAYIALFICTSTKAIHLELVSDLSTAGFLAAFRRFTSRRGHCRNLWSDCASNFVGASKELDIMFKNRKSEVAGEIAELLAIEETQWHFIPPGSPHFGGLWEAGVKSVKAHLKRTIGQSWLTFEEYNTLLCQVEACVNSRPLTPISNSIDDISPLTPGHFLIGEPLITVPEGNLENVSVPPLQRWQIVQKIVQNLWSRWSNEYLTMLQNRYKWSTKKGEPEIGAIVLVKDERLPPGKWILGRIMDKHPGKDGLTRVVTLKIKDSLFKRPVTKISPLPLEV